MKTELWAEFQELYRSQVEPVFRFHLARCGDWRAAQSHTAETFRRMLDWFDPDLARSGLKCRILWKIALFVHHRGLERDEDNLFLGDALPGQAQLASFAGAAATAEHLASLPRQQADALALQMYGGLTMEEVGALVGFKKSLSPFPDATGAEMMPRPVGDFNALLETHLREYSAGRVPRARKAQTNLWHWRYRSGHAAVWVGRIAAAILIGAALFTALSSFRSARFSLPEGEPVLVTVPVPTAVPTYALDPVDDDLVVLDESGKIQLFSLRSGRIVRGLSSEGFYPFDAGKARYPPVISPDGRWLTIVRPRYEDTILLPLRVGDEPRVVSGFPIQLHWAPDGKSAVYVDPENPRALRLYQIESGGVFPSMDLPEGEILAAGWSPNSTMIGVAYLQRRVNDERTVGLAIVEPYSPDFKLLAEVPVPENFYRREFTLLFTSDGDEIWFPAANVAVSVATGETSSLANEPFSSFFAQQGYLSLEGQQPPANDRLILSPDETRAAVLMSRIDTGQMGVLAVHNGINLATQNWITYFGQINTLAWTSDSANLIVERIEANGPAILRVDAESGFSERIRPSSRLIGVVERLRDAAWRPAQRSALILAPTAVGGVWRKVTVPGGFLTLEVPPDWSVWETSGNDFGALAIANFTFTDPFKFAALPPGLFVLYIQQREDTGGMSLRMRTEGAPGPDLDRLPVQKVEINGLSGFRKDVPRPDGTYIPTINLQADGRLVSIWMAPGIRVKEEEILQQILDSLVVDPLAADLPQPES